MVKTILMIKSEYLKFLKKKEVVGRPIVDKIGKLKTFYLPVSEWLYSIYQKDKKQALGLFQLKCNTLNLFFNERIYVVFTCNSNFFCNLFAIFIA